jgi:type IV pilus assembly protein PilW
MSRIAVSQQRGFSLVELMVALAVGLMLVAGISLLFANSSTSASEFDKSLRQIENGRFAMDALVEDISVAGYFGEAVADATGSAISPCATSVQVAADLDAMRSATPAVLPTGVQGLSAAQAAALACLTNHKPGTPALIVRRLDSEAVPTTSITPGLVYLQSSHNVADINATYKVGTDASTLDLRARDGSTNAVRRYLARVYYVASCNECGQDTIPTLKRAELNGGVIRVSPLAEGIDQLGFDFGFDNNSDGIPDEYVGLNDNASPLTTAQTAARGWDNVVAVRVHVISRTTETSTGVNDARTYAIGLNGTVEARMGPMNDSFKRRAYTSTARLNTIAGNREAP